MKLMSKLYTLKAIIPWEF